MLLDLHACAAIVEDFGEASWLRINPTKCSIHPIRCEPEEVDRAEGALGYVVVEWPCKYHGLPLGLRESTTTKLQPMVDNAANRLHPWCIKLLNRGGRSILVQTTLSVIPVYAMMSLDIPNKTLDALQKISRGFLWKEQQDMQGSHCFVASDRVVSPKCHGGLDVPNLRLSNLALRCR